MDALSTLIFASKVLQDNTHLRLNTSGDRQEATCEWSDMRVGCDVNFLGGRTGDHPPTPVVLSTGGVIAHIHCKKRSLPVRLNLQLIIRAY